MSDIRERVRAPFFEALERRTLLAGIGAEPEVAVEHGVAGAAVAMAALVPQALPPPLPIGLLVTVRGDMPAAAAGTQSKVNQFVNVLNLSGTRASGPMTVRLYLSRDSDLDANDAEVATVTRTLRLEPLESREVRVKAAQIPAAADGPYRLLAVAFSPTIGSAPAAAMPLLVVTPSSVDLSASLGQPLPATLTPGGKATLRLRVRHETGSAPAKGTVTVAVYASADAAAGRSGSPMATVPLKLALRPGASRLYRIKFVVPEDLTPAPVFLTAVIDPGASISDSNDSNNAAVTASPVTVE